MFDYAIPNAPNHELARSPAADRVGRLAAASGLLLSHFEYRTHLETPDPWQPPGRDDLAGRPYWSAGRLVEHKYGHFRYENPIGSFHPGHRSKWTTHELCHGLVGFALRPGATPLYHSLAARLNEVLPVALYYFFDEAYLRRCPLHAGGGALTRTGCDACEALAARGPLPKTDETLAEAARWTARGHAYIEGELAAIARSIRTGQPVSYRHGHLDLCSDALAYVAAHGPRLNAPQTQVLTERFFDGPQMGWHTDLDSLRERVIALSAYVSGESEAPPALIGGRDRWVAQDVAARLTQVAVDCSDELAGELDHLVVHLADAPRPTAPAEARAGYEALAEDWFLPPVHEIFAVGYTTHAGLSRASDTTAEGIGQSLPGLVTLLGDEFTEVATQFADQEAAERGPIARRFTRWFVAAQPGPVADVACYEAAMAHPAQADVAADTFDLDMNATGPLKTADGAEVLRLGIDAGAVLNALEDDSIEPPEPAPYFTVVRRLTGGDLLVAELSEGAADVVESLQKASKAPSELGLSAEELLSLRELQVLVPARYPVRRGRR